MFSFMVNVFVDGLIHRLHILFVLSLGKELTICIVQAHSIFIVY